MLNYVIMSKNKKNTPDNQETDWILEKEFLSKLIVGIGEVAKITGVPQRQLRYWEQKGIIKAISESGTATTRRFNCSEIKKITLIKDLLDEGYTLEAAHQKVEQRRQRLNAVFSKLKDK